MCKRHNECLWCYRKQKAGALIRLGNLLLHCRWDYPRFGNAGNYADYHYSQRCLAALLAERVRCSPAPEHGCRMPSWYGLALDFAARCTLSARKQSTTIVQAIGSPEQPYCRDAGLDMGYFAHPRDLGLKRVGAEGRSLQPAKNAASIFL